MCMCGIAGMVGLPWDETIQARMLNTMLHRGPDGNGQFETENCCLLHSRLAIIDPGGGAQPMHFTWQRETYTIVYNGELYNSGEVKKLLIKLGHQFLGHSDTEIVLHAYAQWAEGCVERLNGIFAFAVWEHKHKKLFLARDRIGVKPLFYSVFQGGILFASEIKTILAYSGMKAKIDVEGIGEILLMGPGRTPGCGVFSGISELEPGCYGYYCSGKWNWKRYWKLLDTHHAECFEETAEKIRYLVTDSISRQMVSDVPIGTFLSGGLDSSLISAVCAKEMEKQGLQLDTFSVDYEKNEQFFVPGKFQPTSDGAYIDIMNRQLGSAQHWTVLETKQLLDALEDATIARDLPGMADVDISLLLFCNEIKKHVKVALSGECADEIFGGYPWFTDPQVRALDGFPWSQNTKMRSSLLPTHIRAKLDPEQYVRSRYQKTLEWCDILPETDAKERRMKEMTVLNMRWFMQTLLDRKDRMSMFNGLEVRVPFCDYRLAEYLYSVPWEYKYYGGREKGLLRYAMADYLPEEVLYRKKSPYPKTYNPQYMQMVSERLRGILKSKTAPIHELLDHNALKSILEDQHAWPWYGQLMKTPQTIAYFIQLNFWLEHYNIDILV